MSSSPNSPYNPQRPGSYPQSRQGIDETDRPGYRQLKAILAVALLALGVYGAIWIAGQLAVLLSEPSKIPLINQFMTLDAPSRVIATPSGNIEFPPSFGATVGTGLYLAVLYLALSMTKLFITSGVALLENQVGTLLKSIRQELERMQKAEK